MCAARFALRSADSLGHLSLSSAVRATGRSKLRRLWGWAALVLLAWGGWLAPGLQGQTAHFTSALVSIGSGFGDPWAVAVDGSGNVYIADIGNNSVLKETLSGGSYTQSTLPFSGLSSPEGVAVDGSGNVYIADTGNNRVLKETLSGGSYTQSTIFSSGFDQPAGVAVDGSGNVYILIYQNMLLKETLSAGTYTQSTIPTSGLDNPEGVAVDGSGNVYIADENSGRVLKETLSGGSYTQSTIASGLLAAQGVAVDGSGNVYIAATNNQQVFKLLFSGGANFGSAQVGATSSAITLTFTFDSAGTINAPAVLTQGAPNLDFTDAGTGTCTTNGTSHSYASGDTCTVDALFTPTRAGTRYGAVILSSAVSGAAIATEYIYGTGLGPQMVFSPPAQSTIFSSGLDFPYGVAVDSSGNVYIANADSNSVLKETLSGGAYTQSTIGSGLDSPEGVAVDGSGNVYISDGTRVWKETLSGAAYTQSMIAGSLNDPEGVAVDGSGNVYIADTLDGNLLKETLSGGSYTQSKLCSCVIAPTGVAVDGSGNVYISDSHLVLKLTPSGSGYTQSTIGSNLDFPSGVAVDISGNVYIADGTPNSVLKETLSGGSYTQSTIVSGLNGPELSGPRGVAVDGSGNVYITDTGNDSVLKEDVADAPTLTFNTPTPVGSDDPVDGPQTVSISNLGNQDLNFSLVSYAANFPSNGADTNLCDSSTTLAGGSSCDVSANFDPTGVGPNSGSVALTDNNLNVTNATQSIALSGTGIPPITLAPATLPAGTFEVAYGQQTFAATGGTAPYMFSIAAGLVPPGLSLSSNGILSGTPTAVGSFTFSVTATDSNGFTASQSYTLTIAPAAATVTLSNLTQTYTGSPLSATVTTNPIGLAVTVTYNGSSTPPTNAGNYTVDATINNSNYSGTATGTLVIGKAATTTTLSASASSLNPNQSLTLTAQVQSTTVGTPAGSVNFYDGTMLLGTATLSGGTATFTTSMLTPGVTNSLTAAYQSSQNYAGSTSAAAVSVVVAPLDFSLTNQSVSVVLNGGVTPTLTFSISPTYGVYPSTVTFSASGLPSGATATFTPATIAANGGAQTVSWQIQTGSGTAQNHNPFKRGEAPLVLSCLLLPLLGRRKSRLGRGMVLLLVMAGSAVGFAALSGCGSNYNDYTVTMTATSGNVQHSFNVFLGVKQ